MGILTKTAVKGILKQNEKGDLFLVGKMSNGKPCVVNIIDTTNGEKNKLSKS